MVTARKQVVVARVVRGVAIVLFLLACVFAGYANERLKGLLEAWERLLLVCGFIIGAGLACRALVDHSRRRIDSPEE